jgi:hypothetical protein
VQRAFRHNPPSLSNPFNLLNLLNLLLAHFSPLCLAEARRGMARILVNNEAHTIEIDVNTWGDLLAWADRTSAAQGRLVTAVRLDGVDEPSFRDAALAARALDEVATVEFDVASPASLVAESVDEALSGLDGLRQHALDVARRFRGTRVVFANQGLAELIQGLRTLVSLVDALGGAMGLPIETLTFDGRPALALIEDLGEPLASLGEAQAREDWVTVADILEFDVEPALARCHPFFTALATLTRQATTAH